MNECLQHDDCLYNIFDQFDMKNLLQCSLVNKQFLKISQHELLWKKLYHFDIPCHQHYYQTFKQWNELHQFLLRYKQKSLNQSLELKSLYLCNNKIITIPSTLSQLNLQSLYISANQLTDISALGQLQQLQILHLDNNQLTDISALGQCQQLQYLYLSHNQLTDISVLGQCQQLRYLNIRLNPLTTIPLINAITVFKN